MRFLYGTRGGPGNIRDGVRGRGDEERVRWIFSSAYVHIYLYVCVCVGVCVCVCARARACMCVWRKEEKIILFYLYT